MTTERLFDIFIDSKEYKKLVDENEIDRKLLAALRDIEVTVDKEGYKVIENLVDDIVYSREQFGFINGFKLAMQIAIDCAPETARARMEAAIFDSIPVAAEPMDFETVNDLIGHMPLPYKLDILDVCQEFSIKLDRKNRAPCSFHKGRTPSFTVTPEKNLGCGAGGDAIRLKARLLNITDGEVLKALSKPETQRERMAKLKRKQEQKTISQFAEWILNTENILCAHRRFHQYRIWEIEKKLGGQFWENEELYDLWWGCVEENISALVEIDMLLAYLEESSAGFYEVYKGVVDELENFL